MHRTDDLQDALSRVQEVETSNFDVTGWQTAYAWDARRIGGAVAVQDDNANRAGFLDSAERLRTQLAEMPTDVLTDDERATFAAIEEQWAAYFVVDEQAAASYARGDQAAVDAGDALILGPGDGVYFQVWEMTAELRSSLGGRVEAAAVAADEQRAQARAVMIAAVLLGAVATLLMALAVTRRIIRPLGAVVSVAQAMTAGDLTRSTGVVQRDEVGAAAAALDEAQGNLRALLSSVVTSADAVAASSEELSASSAQISASAEETSAQSGVVVGAAEEVSRNVATVAAGAEEMGASIREIATNAAEASEVRRRP